MGLILVTGGRHWPHKDIIYQTLRELRASEKPWFAVVHGDCPTGADRICRDFCDHLGIAEFRCPAKWKTYGRPAGMMRNGWMLYLPVDSVMAFHENLAESKGTRGMIALARKQDIPCYHHDGEKWRNPK